MFKKKKKKKIKQQKENKTTKNYAKINMFPKKINKSRRMNDMLFFVG